MNKVKKISMAVVATVMAGAMIVPLAACGGGNDPGQGPGGTTDGIVEVEKGSGLKLKVKDGHLDYAENTEIHTAMGYNSVTTGITYDQTLIQTSGFLNEGNATATFAGKTYSSDQLKPAWRELSSVLGIKVEDKWIKSDVGKEAQAGKHISYLKGLGTFNNYGLVTASADTISTEGASNGSPLLDINKYLDYMPNYKAFVTSNDVVRLSLTADTTSGAMYMLPYFDGNNDIEKYVLIRKDIVEVLLNTTDLSAATGTFAGQATAKAKDDGEVKPEGTHSSVKSFMGKVAADNYEIAVTDPAALDTTKKTYGNDYTAVLEGHEKDTVTIVVDYGAVITALKDENSALYDAVNKALPEGTAPQIASGNIVDIQNQIIDATNGACTGAQLTKVLQEYIKVAYHKKGETTAFYTKLSDVFNSAYAAWDVDLYVALGRSAMTSSALLGDKTKGEGAYFLGSRTGYTNRTYDIASMAGELYGVRGLTSRYANLYTYVDAEGNMKDARSNPETWEALSNMHALAVEGLYYTGKSATDGVASIGGTANSNKQIYSSTDYVQTQTATGGFAVDGKVTKAGVETGYNYAPILTPVSRWDIDGDGTHEKVMRFTESWRGVKDGGLCIPKGYVQNNPDRFSALLAVIDWMYSNDGQMVLTYGPFSEAGNITRTQGKVEHDGYGTWWGTPVEGTIEGVSATDMAALKEKGVVDTYDGKQYYVTEEYQAKYLCYGNHLYTATLYNGKQVPTPTDEVFELLYSLTSGKFTNFARYYIGSALNFGNKDQGFEAQCTPKCGLAGAEIWAIANVNGTIEHTKQVIDSENWWYTLSPTILPFTKSQITSMSDNYKTVSGKGTSASENFFYANSKANGNLLTDIMYFGFTKQGEDARKLTCVDKYNIPTSAQGVVELLNTEHLDTVDGFMNQAWGKLKTYYTKLQQNH